MDEMKINNSQFKKNKMKFKQSEISINTYQLKTFDSVAAVDWSNKTIVKGLMFCHQMHLSMDNLKYRVSMVQWFT